MAFRRLLFVLIIASMTVIVRAQIGGDLYDLPPSTAPLSTGGMMDITDNGRTIIAANMLNDTVSLVDISGRSVIAEIRVGRDPRGVAFTRDETQALVINRADGTLSVIDIAGREVIATHDIGILPYVVVTTGDNIAYVSLQGTNEVIQMNYTTGEILNRIPTPPLPTGLTLWGANMLYVTHLWTGEVSLIYTPQLEVVRTVSTGVDSSLSFSLTISRSDGRAYLPQSRSNTANTNLTFDSAILPMLNVLDLRTMGVAPSGRIFLALADRPVNMPFSVAIDAVRDWAFVANAGTDDVSIINLNTGLAIANFRVGSNPRSAILSNDATLLYVHNALEGSISVLDTRELRIRDTLPISDLSVPIGRVIGAEYFHSARDPRMGARWISCASCHFDGLSDGRVWQLEDEAFNTPALFGLDGTGPYNRRGTWDEVTDVELKIRELQFGAGLLDIAPNSALGDPHDGLSLDLDLLAEYLISLDGPPAPTPTDAVQVARGAELFDALNCASCHSGTNHNDGQWHDVGTGGAFVTPSLNWLWLSAPYLHDGRAETLRDVFIIPGAHQLAADLTPDEIDALVAYLMTLPHNE